MEQSIQRKTLPLAIIMVVLVGSGCAETIRLSRGTQIPPEHRSVSSAEVTESFTRHVRGEHVSMAATLIDFSYVRAITRERGRSRDEERDAYRRYIRRQTTFYVNLVLHGRDNCRSLDRRPVRDDDDDGDDDDDDEGGSGDELSMEGWHFTLRSSTGREREPADVEPGATQLAPSGGCLVQGYVHFPGSVSTRDEWIELEASAGERGRLRARVRWALDHSFNPPHRRPRHRGDRPRPRPQPAADETDQQSQHEGVEETPADETAPESSESPEPSEDTFTE